MFKIFNQQNSKTWEATLSCLEGNGTLNGRK